MFCYHKTSASNNEKFFRKGIFLSITLLIATTVLTSCKGGTSVNSEIRSSEFNNNEVVYPSNPALVIMLRHMILQSLRMMMGPIILLVLILLLLNQ